MRRIRFFLPACLLLALLTACGSGDKTAPFSPADDAKALLDTAAFSEPLTEIDGDIACARYGIDPATVTESAVYGSTGTTAEELALFTFDSADHAQDAQKALGYWLEDRVESLTDYQPGEVAKLKDAVVEVREASLLLAVCGDYGPVTDFLER